MGERGGGIEKGRGREGGNWGREKRSSEDCVYWRIQEDARGGGGTCQGDL